MSLVKFFVFAIVANLAVCQLPPTATTTTAGKITYKTSKGILRVWDPRPFIKIF